MKSRKKILVVEDDRFNRLYISIYFQYTADITLCSNGKEALEKLKYEIFDLIITDLKMSKMSGFTLIETIKKLNISTPIIVVSAYSDPLTIDKALNMGVNEYFSKPFLASNLFLSSIKLIFGTKYPHLPSRSFNRLTTLIYNNYRIFNSLNNYISFKDRCTDRQEFLEYQQDVNLKKKILDYSNLKTKLVNLKGNLPGSCSEIYREVYFDFLQTENICDRLYKDVLTDPPY